MIEGREGRNADVRHMRNRVGLNCRKPTFDGAKRSSSMSRNSQAPAYSAKGFPPPNEPPAAPTDGELRGLASE